MTNQPGHRIDESDIGSGEKPPSQRDTEKLIEEVGKNKALDPTHPQPHDERPERKRGSN